jgi:uncharacterized protein (DUF1501 family)
VVYVFLFGGNDGINNVVPINQYDRYAQLRPNIKLAQNRLINLDNTLPIDRQVGLHPALQPFKALYDNDRLSIIQRVAYPDPNKSHFRSAELLMSGQDGNTNLQDGELNGWMANYLQNRYPEYAGLPLINMQDPLAIQLGSPGHPSSQGLKHDLEHDMETVLYGQDPAGFYTQVAGLSGEPLTNFPNSEYGDILQYIAGVESSTNAYAQIISQRFNSGTNASSASYGNDDLSGMLKSVARLISGGCETKIYMTNQGGFDTHVNAVDAGDTTQGTHAMLLSRAAQAVQAFQNDLDAQGVADKVITVVFSEFGRKAIENSNRGTDHGTLAPMYIIGKNVASGVVGDNVDLFDLDNQGAPDASQLQNDYRTVHSTILQDWMGAPNSAIAATFQTEDWVANKLPIIETVQTADPGCYLEPTFLEPTKVLKINTLLAGPYEATNSRMTTWLRDKLPTTDPYLGTVTASSIANNWVDWVLVQLRSPSDPVQVISQKAAILRNDGTLVNVNGDPQVDFLNVQESTAFVAIFHHNHLPVMTDQPISLAELATTPLDFTDPTVGIYGTETRMTINGRACMVPGDANEDGVIDENDYSDYWSLQNGGSVPYMQSEADFNLDGVVNAVDMNDFWRGARTRTTQIPR